MNANPKFFCLFLKYKLLKGKPTVRFVSDKEISSNRIKNKTSSQNIRLIKVFRFLAVIFNFLN